MISTVSKRYPIELGEVEKVSIFLVGCGGTGSFAALHLARLAYALPMPVRLVFIDPDVVESKNIGRQNFAPAEIGRNKAEALAWRYSRAFGLDITAYGCPVQEVGDLSAGWRGVALRVGCVDNGAARSHLAGLDYGQRAWWLDSGNGEHTGQVLIGNSQRREPVIDLLGVATEVPLPSVQAPELVDERTAEDGFAHLDAPLSCAELLATEAQGLMVNQMMASWVAVYASRLLKGRDLDLMATYIDLVGGAVRSVGVTGPVGEMQVAEFREYNLLGEYGPEGALLILQNHRCPLCDGEVAEGRDVPGDAPDDEEVAIIFCPACQWQEPVEELELTAALLGGYEVA